MPDLPADPRTRRRSGVPFAALGAMAIWGGSFVAVDMALDSLQPFTLVATRSVLGGALLSAVLIGRGGPFLPARGDRGRSVVLGLLLGAHISLQAVGMTYTSASHSGWIVAFTPVAIAIGAQVFLRERLERSGWLGVALGVAGVACVTLDAPHALDEARLGDLLQFVSCFTWASYTLTSVEAVRRSGALAVTALALWASAIFTLPIAVFEVLTHAPLDRSAAISVVSALLYLGILASGVATSLWARAQERYGPQRSAVVLYLQPFVTLVFARALRGDSIGSAALLGGVLVLFGVGLVARARPNR